ncbi:NnrS family protein [Arcobacter sp. KX21116]|uniref:NnrS family protein n=1 Tax=Arcobacter iocasae TaxID=2906515 RepID=UPI0035D473A5
MKNWYNKFISQPHQPFFTNGILFLLLFVLTIFLNYSNLVTIKVPLLVFHAYALLFVVFIQLFLGFLFVVFPKFLMQADIKKEVYSKQAILYFIGSLLFFISIFTSEVFNIFSIFFLFCIQLSSFKILYNIHIKSTIKIKKDTLWVLISFACGLGANLLFIISFIPLSYASVLRQLSINSGFYLFIFMLIFSIAQRMVPFFSSAKIEGYVINKSKYILETVFALLVLKVLILTFLPNPYNLISDIPLFIIFTKELIKWKLSLKKVSSIMWILYISLYWIPIGFFLSIMQSLINIFDNSIVFEQSIIHIFALGYFCTILLGFGTRVTLGHSGAIPTANRFTVILYLVFQVVVFLRLFTAYSINFGFDYLFFINLSAILFLLVFILWSSKYIVILLKGK